MLGRILIIISNHLGPPEPTENVMTCQLQNKPARALVPDSIIHLAGSIVPPDTMA